MLIGKPTGTSRGAFGTCADGGSTQSIAGGIQRVKVDTLKSIIRAVNTNNMGHLRVSGNKPALTDSVVGLLRNLHATRSEHYLTLARLVGEGQGYTYTGISSSATPAAGPSSASSSSAAAGSSALALGSASASAAAAAAAASRAASSASPYLNGPGSSTSTGGAANPSSSSYAAYGGMPQAGGAGSSSYASRSTDFGLNRNSPATQYRPYPYGGPGQAGGASSSSAGGLPGGAASGRPSGFSYQSTYGGGQNGYGSSGSLGASGRTSPYPQYGGASGAGMSSYNSGPGAGALGGIPTSWPTKPAPRPVGLAGQPAVPINFKPSPFYKIVTAVSTVTTLQREFLPLALHPNGVFLDEVERLRSLLSIALTHDPLRAGAGPGDRKTGSCTIHLTEDQRQKLTAAR